MSLFRTQLLVALNINQFLRGKKRAKSLAAVLLVMLAIAPSYGGYIYVMARSFAWTAHNQLPILDMMLTGVYSTAQYMVLFAGIPIVYATLFQSNDLSILLPLPLRPAQIVAAKVAVIYVIELIIGCAFFLPTVVLYAHYAQPGIGAVVVSVLALVALPIIPLGISTILSMVIVNLPGIGKSKWFWYMLMMTAMMAASLTYTMLVPAGHKGDMSDFVQVKMTQIGQFGRMLPGASLGLAALAKEGTAGFGMMAAYLAVCAGYMAAVVVAGEWLYVRPIVRGDAVATRSKGRSVEAHAQSFLLSYVRKEFACVLKDPAVAMNAIGGYIALPLLAVSYTVMKYQTRGKVDIIGSLMKAVNSPQVAQYLPTVVIGFAIGLAMFGSMSSLFAASYSKDGKRLWIEKTLPVRPYDIYLGKLLMGLALVTPLNLIAIALAAVAVPFSPGHWLYVVVLSEAVILWNSAAGLAVDAFRPKLQWKDTVQAVKQNANVVIGMGFTLAGIAANIGLLVLFQKGSAPAAAQYSLVLAANLVLCALALWAGSRAARRLNEIAV